LTKNILVRIEMPDNLSRKIAAQRVAGENQINVLLFTFYI